MRRPITLGLCAFLLATGAALCWPQQEVRFPTSLSAAEVAAAVWLDANTLPRPLSYEFNRPVLIPAAPPPSEFGPRVVMCGMARIANERPRRRVIVYFDPSARDAVVGGWTEAHDLLEAMCDRAYHIGTVRNTLMP